MNVMDAIYQRRAVREYSGAPVDRGLIRAAIAAATQAPNALNRQPWSFVVVTNRAMLDVCSERAKAHALATLTSQPPFSRHRQQLASRSFDIFHGAPALIVICATEPDPMAEQDCCLAAENLMLAAHAAGLGTCWIGFAQPWLNQPEGKRAFRIPAGHVAVAPIVIGHPGGETPAPPRRPAEITWIDA